MKIDVVRPPTPPRPPAQVLVVLTETEARDIRSGMAGLVCPGQTFWDFYRMLDDVVRAL